MVNHNPGNLRRSGRRLIIRYLFSQRWCFITVSDWVRRDFIAHAPWLDKQRIKTIYNCINIDHLLKNQFSRDTACEKLGISPHHFIFGNIHRLDPSKGHDYLIRAFAHAFHDKPNAQLVIIGGGSRQQLLEGIAKELGVSQQVHLTGLIPSASQYARAFDTFVIPSLHEGFGLGILEGMAASIPIIASDGGALPEVLGDTGALFPAGDHLALAKSMLEIYESSGAERNSAGEATFHRLNTTFTHAHYHAEFRALI